MYDLPIAKNTRTLCSSFADSNQIQVMCLRSKQIGMQRQVRNLATEAVLVVEACAQEYQQGPGLALGMLALLQMAMGTQGFLLLVTEWQQGCQQG